MNSFGGTREFRQLMLLEYRVYSETTLDHSKDIILGGQPRPEKDIPFNEAKADFRYNAVEVDSDTLRGAHTAINKFWRSHLYMKLNDTHLTHSNIQVKYPR